MLLAKLLLSGLLIAGGLTLGAFTLHGYFDPQWAQRQSQAATGQKRPGGAKKALHTFHNRSRFVESRTVRPQPAAKRRQAATAGAGPGAGDVVKAARTKPAAKPPARKKVAEKTKPEPEPQQAAFQWPLWNLFEN